MNRTITILTPENLQELEHYAELRYSISQIAIMLHLDVAEFRVALMDPSSDIAEAYNAGKLKSSIKRRETILEAANKGAEWAIKLLDQYEIDQKEDELMP